LANDVPFLLHGEEKKILPIDAIKMLIKQVQHAKVANVLATEGRYTVNSSTNDRETTQVQS
jgi:hypothetical protein